MLVLAIKAGVSGEGGNTCSSKTGQFCLSLTDNFTLLFPKLLKLILNANTANIQQLFGPKKLSELSRSVPLVVKSLRPPKAWTSSECKWLNVDVGLVRFMFVVLENNTLTVSSTKGGWFAWMCARTRFACRAKTLYHFYLITKCYF